MRSDWAVMRIKKERKRKQIQECEDHTQILCDQAKRFQWYENRMPRSWLWDTKVYPEGYVYTIFWAVYKAPTVPWSAERLGFPFHNTNPLIIFKIIDMTFVPGNHPPGAFTANSTRRPSFQMIEHWGFFSRSENYYLELVRNLRTRASIYPPLILG